MTSKVPSPYANETKRKTDDFRLINGVTKNLRTRLHATGIYTFSQLADMSAHEIITELDHPADLDAERIIREDWVGQAKKLAETPREDVTPADAKDRSHKAKPKKDDASRCEAENAAPEKVEGKTSEVNPGERLTSFVLELKINEDNTVKEVRVMHIESKDKEAETKWTGWQEMRLLNFIAHRAKLALPASQPPSPPPPPPLPPPLPSSKTKAVAAATAPSLAEDPAIGAKSAAPASIKNSPHSAIESIKAQFQPAMASAPQPAPVSNRLEIVPVGRNFASRSLRLNEAYNVRISLDPAEFKSHGSGTLAYTATIHAKRLEGKAQCVVGQTHGETKSGADISFSVEGNPLSQGAYRLGATIIFVTAPENGENQKDSGAADFATYLEGGLLQVY